MVTRLAPRPWLPASSASRIDELVDWTMTASATERSERVTALIATNARIHDLECVNLNPATNTMSPAAVAAMAGSLSTRTSLGYPGAKYEMGLEAIEEIETIAAQLAGEVFDASYVEFRVPSGAMANLMVFLATASPGDAIIVPPATIAGHVTHHEPGAAGLYGLDVHHAPVDAERYTVDVAGLAELAARVRPRLITLGSSLNLHHHDVAGARAVADEVGATLMFDAAHLSGPIAGGAWPNPLHEGAHVMTMSTYKSLAGPPAGLVLTNEADLAERIEAIAFPGLTANFDVGKTAALALTLNDWLACGRRHGADMVACASALAEALGAHGAAVHQRGDRATLSHAFALDASGHGGGTALANHLRTHNLLTSAIGLPSGLDDGLRLGTNELVRWGAGPGDLVELAALIARAVRAVRDAGTDTTLSREVSAFRQRFTTVHHTIGSL